MSIKKLLSPECKMYPAIAVDDETITYVVWPSHRMSKHLCFGHTKNVRGWGRCWILCCNGHY
jgi:hypothetical protein